MYQSIGSSLPNLIQERKKAMEKKLSLSQQIAEIGAGLKFEDLPERVVNNSKIWTYWAISLPPAMWTPASPA